MHIFKKILNFFSEYRLVFRIINRFKYPGLSIGNGANLNILGNFSYGKNCNIGVGSNIIIPENTSLKVGAICYIGRYVELGPGSNIKIGDQTSIQDRNIILGDVTIGSYCTIAPNVYMSSGRHYYDMEATKLIKDQDELVSRNKEFSSVHSRPIVIGDDCWLGINVVVMPGVEIGKGVIVGANSVVTKSIAPYNVVAGVPAKFIKKRLNFVPTKCIVYDNSNDWPYFYSGFEISKASLLAHSEFGGILAKNEFVICLDASLGGTLHINAKKNNTVSCNLSYCEQTKEISSQLCEIVFMVQDISRKTNRFCLQIESVIANIIIEKAWIE